MRQRLFAWYCALLTLALTPMMALAQRRDVERDPSIDARLEGYDPAVALERSSTALTWLLLVVLGIVCLAVLFKDARRTHLD